MIPFEDDLIQRYRAEGWWDGLTIHDLFTRAAERRPEHLALADAPNRAEFTVGDPVRWTYGEVGERADRLAAALVGLGVGKGDVVMVQLPNVAELVLVYLAASRIGAIVSPLPVQYRAHELRLTVSLVEPAVFITTANVGGFDHVELVTSIRAEIPSIREVLAIVPEPTPRVRSLTEILETAAETTGLASAPPRAIR